MSGLAVLLPDPDPQRRSGAHRPHEVTGQSRRTRELGADDYVVKPIRVAPEFIARVPGDDAAAHSIGAAAVVALSWPPSRSNWKAKRKWAPGI
ncbi:MAG: hypothetical protein R2855_15245 [Thermomicrobiales bacterium]